VDYVEQKYINLLSSRLRNFSKKSNLYNFSCPLCGDSKSHKRKARGYILEKKGRTGYYCHNCNVSLSLPDFIKTVAPDLYGPFLFEKFRDSDRPKEPDFHTSKPKFIDYGILKNLKKVSDLPDDDPIKSFVLARRIPDDFHGKLFACPKFMSWVNTIIPGKFGAKDLHYDGPRLVIPFMDKNKKTFAFQGRALTSGTPKYITISLNKEEHILYGRDTVELRDPLYVLEGPIDSFFIPNAVAVASANLLVASTFFPKDFLVLIFDNEARNEQIVSTMKRAIETNHRIVIWPSNFMYKDINEAVMDGMPVTSILEVIKNNTYFNLAAKLVLSSWRK